MGFTKAVHFHLTRVAQGHMSSRCSVMRHQNRLETSLYGAFVDVMNAKLTACEFSVRFVRVADTKHEASILRCCTLYVVCVSWVGFWERRKRLRKVGECSVTDRTALASLVNSKWYLKWLFRFVFSLNKVYSNTFCKYSKFF